MKNKKLLEAARLLLKDLKEYEKAKCHPFVPECARCILHQLYGLLAWYEDLVDEYE